MKRNANKSLFIRFIMSMLCLGLLTGCGSMGAPVPADGSALSQQGQVLYGQDQGEDDGNRPENALADSVQQSPGSSPDGMAVEEMEVHFIDVGQGDATLVKCGGQALLIDTGVADKGTALQNYLKKQGVEKLDYLILTHPDADHIGAAPVILTKFEVGQVFMSDFEKDNSTYRKLIQALDDKRLKPVIPKVGSTVTLGSSICTFLAPLDEYEDPNNASVAILIQNGGNRFLFTGDAQEEAEADLLSSGQDIHADVYKAGHHGSRTSSGEAFLDAVEPVSVVISCGEDNAYGHPHAATLNQLRSRGILVYRTDEQGSIIAWSDGSAITWNTAPSDSWKAGEPTGSSQTAGSPDFGSADTVDSMADGHGTDMAGGRTEAGGTDMAGGRTQAGGTDMAGGKAEAGKDGGTDFTGTTFILNTKTMKFHLPDCRLLPTANREDTGMSRDEVIARGYEPCKKCNP